MILTTYTRLLDQECTWLASVCLGKFAYSLSITSTTKGNVSMIKSSVHKLCSPWVPVVEYCS